MSEVKQEGDFKIKSKPKKPKNLGVKNEVTKVELKEPVKKAEEEITKVVIPKEQQEVVQIGEVKETTVEKPIVDVVEDVKEFTPIKEVEVAKVEAEVKEALRDEKVLGKQLPENIEKLVSFMEDTGGTIEDYTRLNADYSSINETVLLKEYYKKNKPYLDESDVELLLEDFSYDEELDEDIDIRKKKLAFKEEVAKAKGFLEETKVKYYDEIKLRSNVNPDTQKATDFFNRYNKQQETAKQQHEQFQESTKELFNDDFEGFDIKVGDKNYKYNIQNRDKVAENQSNINNLVGKFLDSDGNVSDTKGYHKAMYAADNVDKIASHFYEQGKADAVKDVINKSKNLSDTKARSQQGDVFVNGFKVKAISGQDSSRLRIKTKKFN
jgi:hypothetical protein